MQLTSQSISKAFSIKICNKFRNPKDITKTENLLVMRIACLDKNIEYMFDLIRELFSSPNFGDSKVVSNFLRNESDDISNGLI